MYCPQIDERVLLAEILPNQWLAVGEAGVVRSRWHGANEAYEVSFPRTPSHDEAIAILRPDQIDRWRRPHPKHLDDDGFVQERYPVPLVDIASRESRIAAAARAEEEWASEGGRCDAGEDASRQPLPS